LPDPQIRSAAAVCLRDAHGNQGQQLALVEHKRFTFQEDIPLLTDQTNRCRRWWLLRRLGRPEHAVTGYDTASALAPTAAERDHLAAQAATRRQRG